MDVDRDLQDDSIHDDEEQQHGQRRPRVEGNRDQERQPNVQRRRLNHPGLIPHDAHTNLNSRYKEVTVDSLLQNGVRERFTYVRLQLMRIVSGTNAEANRGTTRTNYYYTKNRNQVQGNANYTRMFLFREITSTTGQMVYYLETSGQNKIWNKNPQLRDSGVVTIGTCIALLAPEKIVNMLGNEIPIICAPGSCIVLRQPDRFITIPVDPGLPMNTTRAFVVNECFITVNTAYPIQSNCGGNFCDKQRVEEVLRGTRGCGCYSVYSRISNIVIVLDISVRMPNGEVLHMERFSSQRFSMYFLNQMFPPTTRVHMLDNTDSFVDLMDCIDNVVEYINNNGGFTAIGWHKRGAINDQAAQGEGNEENRVEAGELNYHFTSIVPTDGMITNDHGDLEDLKFDVGELSGHEEQR